MLNNPHYTCFAIKFLHFWHLQNLCHMFKGGRIFVLLMHALILRGVAFAGEKTLFIYTEQ